MAEKPPLTYGEVRRVLHLLDPLLAERRIILVGGQAVAFWARYLAPRSFELTAADALTSKDIDFEGSAQSVTRAAILLAGRPKIATMDDHTPNTGIVLFTDSTGTLREIDFIDAPLGLGARDVRDTSVICAREWSRYILDSNELPEEQRVRAVLKLNERIFKRCMKDGRFRAVLHDHGVNPFDAIVAEDPRLPEQVREQRHPQMQTLLDERLKRDRVNRARAAARRQRAASKRAL